MFRRLLALRRVPVLLVLGLGSGTATLFGQCGDNEPAFPVPECRDATTGDEVACTQAGAIRLWPPGLRPGNPDQQLPARRDSTQWQGLTTPGVDSGHELFNSLDVVGDHLYVVYNAGLQVWGIGGADAEDPTRLEVADGWRGDFLAFPPPGDNNFFTHDVAALDPAGGAQDVLIAVSGRDLVGVSIWQHTLSPRELRPLYQDLGSDTVQVRVAEYVGRSYAFAAGGTGVKVYDMTGAAALASPCLDDSGTVCPGVYRGALGSMTSGGYLDVIEKDGRLYVAVSDGNPLPSRPLGLEIWEVDNPAVPSTAELRFSGLSTDTRGPALFEHGGTAYLAVIDRLASERTIRIYDVDACLDADGCGSLGAPVGSRALPPRSVPVELLTHSTRGGVPYLYYGLEGVNLAGTKIEQLLDLSGLGTTDAIVEITGGGGTYTDACTGNTVDYWGDYYAANGHGLRNLSPRVGKFHGDTFYRAAFGILDVHRRSGSGVPTITTTVDDPPPHYMDLPIDFSATAENCDGPEIWDWLDDDTVTSTIDANGGSATITFGLCPGSDCPARDVEVWALKEACADDGSLIEHRAMVTVMEPRPHVRAIDVCPLTDPGCEQMPEPEFPICSVLRFTADLDGRPPFDYLWEVADAGGQVILTSTEPVFDWDTGGAQLSKPIFADGFESGDTSAWSNAVGRPPGRLPMTLKRAGPRELFAARGGSATFDVDLTLSNASGGDVGTQPVTLVGLGDLGFGTPAITVTDGGGGLFSFQANSENATEWRWELEDPANGGTDGCLFYDSCQIYDWGQAGAGTNFRWEAPNVPGMYGVTVSIRNCIQETPLSESVLVEVTEIGDPDPPAVTAFTVNDPDCDLILGFYVCPVGTPITFEVTATGAPDTYEFDWDGDGGFDQQIPVGNAITHTYSTVDLYTPAVRAIRGPVVSDPLEIGNPIIVVDE